MILYYRKCCIVVRYIILLLFILKLFFLVCINIRLERINIFVFIFYFNNIEFCFFYIFSCYSGYVNWFFLEWGWLLVREFFILIFGLFCFICCFLWKWLRGVWMFIEIFFWNRIDNWYYDVIFCGLYLYLFLDDFICMLIDWKFWGGFW